MRLRLTIYLVVLGPLELAAESSCEDDGPWVVDHQGDDRGYRCADDEGGGSLGYRLGVDLGTTWTAAAVARDGRVEMATLGTRSTAVPSVIFVREDETILVGEAASRRGLSEPTRVVREFKRRFGDPTPILIGGAPFAADGLMAKLLRWVVDTVAVREGGPPDRVVVTHPANWGPYKLDLLAQAIRLADVGDAVVISEPEAAAVSYAANGRLEVGEVIAVYDLGGGTFDAAVLRKTTDGFEILGRPDGIERLGGIDFDEAVFSHVAGAAAVALGTLDPDDMAARSAVARLREECVEAKEALSSDTDVVIPVMLPAVQTEVRLTRGEFEELIRPALSPTTDALSRALASAGVLMADLRAVLLVGGSSQIPLVGELLANRLGCPVAIDAHPKHTVAMGAARAGSEVEAPDVAPPPSPPPAPPPPAAPPPPPPPTEAPPAPPRPPDEPASEPPPMTPAGAKPRRWGRKAGVAAAARPDAPALPVDEPGTVHAPTADPKSPAPAAPTLKPASVGESAVPPAPVSPRGGPPTPERVEPDPPEAPIAAPEPTGDDGDGDMVRPWWRRPPVLVGAAAATVVCIGAAVIALSGGEGGRDTGTRVLEPVTTEALPTTSNTSAPTSSVPPAVLRQALLATPFPPTLLPAGFLFCGPKASIRLCGIDSPDGQGFTGGKMGFSENRNVVPEDGYNFVGDAWIWFTRGGGPGQEVHWSIEYWVFADAPSAQAWLTDNRRFYSTVTQVDNVIVRHSHGTSDNKPYDTNTYNADWKALTASAQTFLSQVKAATK